VNISPQNTPKIQDNFHYPVHSGHPAGRRTLAPLDDALDTFLKVHPQFDVAVRELARM